MFLDRRQQNNYPSSFWLALALAVTLNFAAAVSAQTETLRIATYNIQADIGGVTTPQTGLYQVLEGMGEQLIGGIAQPIDIVALQETTSNSITVAPILSNLNSYYNGTAIYAQSPVQGLQAGSNASGNGPNAIVYNTKTLKLLASVGVGTPLGSTNGEYRQVMRYQFEPVGGTISNSFYVYVTHMKSSASGALFTNESLRNLEAAIIRKDELALATPNDPNPRVLYMGDFNLSGSALVTSGSQSISAYQTMTADSPAVQGKPVDPLNTSPQNNNETWDTNATYNPIMTESSTSMRYRDDLQLMTQNIYNGSGPFSLHYLTGSLHAFGNNGSVGLFGNVNASGNTALDNLIANPIISKSTLLSALTTASDHLPVVADYSILLPLLGDIDLDGHRTTADAAAMLNAIGDLNSYKSTHSLSDADLLSIADINGDHLVNNADVQSLLDLLHSGGGAAAVPEPTTLGLTAIGLAFILLSGCSGKSDSRSAVPPTAVPPTAVAATDQSGEREARYPARWWAPVSKEGAPSWEILPQEAGQGEVILSKRQKDLGLLSNFAPTPFEFHHKKYASLEGFWQAMKFPEGPDDPREKIPDVKWNFSREQVEQMTAFDAKNAGDLGSENMKKLGVNWVTFEGRQIEYKPAEPGEHYQLIVAATWEKVRQNPEVKAALLSTGELVLKPDHHQEVDAPAAWKYFDILMDIRRQLQASDKK